MRAAGLRRLDRLRGRCPGETSTYIKPEAVEDFVSKAGFGLLGISIGTSQDACEFRLKEGEDAPPLRFEILEVIEKRIPGFTIVMHGVPLRLSGVERKRLALRCVLVIASDLLILDEATLGLDTRREEKPMTIL